ncbi:MAG: type II toxin-antitoxin system VapC family toxin [Opitutaceae bacterium]
MIYLDTAFLAKLYFREHGSEEVRELVGSFDAVACSAHGRVELAYVFHRKLREGSIDRKGLVARMNLIELDTSKGLISWLPLDSSLLDAAFASVLKLQRKTPLRAADALHLVSARENGFTKIYSNDRHLIAGTRHFGLKGINVVPD